MPAPSSSIPSTGPIENNEITKGDIFDLLNDDSDAKETIELEEPPKAGKTDSEAEDDSEPEPAVKTGKEEIKLADEDEEKEPEIDENELDLVAPARRKDILKKYPTLFKEFPHLEKAYYRDQQYNELFSTPDEAKEVVQYAREFQNYSNEVLGKGNTQAVLKAVKDNNPEAFGKVVDSYLTTLKNVDEKAFYHVIGNTIKSTAAAMASEAQRTNNQDLLEAARLMYSYVMGTTEYTPPTTFSKPENKEEVEETSRLQNERMQFFKERFDTVQGELQSRVDGVLKNTIDQNMDPKNSMTPYVKRVAVNEAMDMVQKQVDTDPQFRKLIDRLWEKAADEKFSKPSIEKIRSAYLSKAKTLLPAAIKKTRNDALRGLGKRVREDNDDNEETVTTNRRESAAPKTLRGSNRQDNPSKGKSTLDFLNED